jgi:hypothetical protein
MRRRHLESVLCMLISQEIEYAVVEKAKSVGYHVYIQVVSDKLRPA